MTVEIVRRKPVDVKIQGGDERIAGFIVRSSTLIWEGMVDGQRACVWGLIPPTILSKQAYLWLWTDDKVVKEHQFTFVRQSQIMINEMLEEYPLIVGHCIAGQERSIRWLKWLGAQFAKPVGNMVPFWIEKKHG